MNLHRLILGALRTNCYILHDKPSNEAAVVDPADEADKIIEKLEELGCNVKYIILTHAHIDHILALDQIKAHTGAQVVIHSADVSALNNDAFNLAVYFHAKSPKTKADIAVNDGDSVMLGENELQFLHTPGHNKGSMCILYGDTLLSGDTLFYLSVGRVDHYGGNYESIIRSIKEKLLLLPDSTQVYPGHGDSTTIGFERENNSYLQEL